MQAQLAAQDAQMHSRLIWQREQHMQALQQEHQTKSQIGKNQAIQVFSLTPYCIAPVQDTDALCLAP